MKSEQIIIIGIHRFLTHLLGEVCLYKPTSNGGHIDAGCNIVKSSFHRLMSFIMILLSYVVETITNDTYLELICGCLPKAVTN